MRSDKEIGEMINKIMEIAQKQSNKRWGDTIYKSLGLTEKKKAITVEQFKQKFEDKIEYGIKMLEQASEGHYVYNLNRRYKKSIADMLDIMGLKYDAKQVRSMSYQEFMKLASNNKWEYVYQRYNSYMEDLDANRQGYSKALTEKYNRTVKNVSRHIAELLGY